MTWFSIEMTPTTPIWRLVLPLTAVGVGMAFIWSPLAATATRNLPPHLAGAGSGVYNTTRQVGSVLGSAGVAAFMTWRIGATMPAALDASDEQLGGTHPPSWLHEPFAAAMSQTLLLPAFFALFGVVAALFLLGFGDGVSVEHDDTMLDDEASYAVEYGGDETFVDDDEYVEYTVTWEESEPVLAPVEDIEAVTEPVRTSRVAARKQADDGDSWRAILDALMAEVPPEPTSGASKTSAHNGFPDDDQKPAVRPSRHRRNGEAAESRAFWFESGGSQPRHEAEGTTRRGRHSTPWPD
jgi:hypothetical protein